jgi:hypothetical protein
LQTIPENFAGNIPGDKLKDEARDPKRLPKPVPGKRNRTPRMPPAPRIRGYADGYGKRGQIWNKVEGFIAGHRAIAIVSSLMAAMEKIISHLGLEAR